MGRSSILASVLLLTGAAWPATAGSPAASRPHANASLSRAADAATSTAATSWARLPPVSVRAGARPSRSPAPEEAARRPALELAGSLTDTTDLAARIAATVAGLQALLREAARPALGPGAEAIFAAVDRAQRAAADELSARDPAEGDEGGVQPRLIASLAGMGGAGADVRPAPAAEHLPATGTQAGGFLVAALGMTFGPGGDGDGDAALPEVSLQRTAEGVAVEAAFHPREVGSRAEVDVALTVTVPGPPAYEERTSGRIEGERCPDAAGSVAFTLAYRGGMAAEGGGMQWQVAVDAVGTVGDDARLAGLEWQTVGSLARQPVPGSGEASTFVELRYDAGWTPTAGSSHALRDWRASSQARADSMREVAGLLQGLGDRVLLLAAMVAEQQWLDGYCVEIEVQGVGPGVEQVAQDSHTPFSALVRHRHEGSAVAATVVAALSDGATAVAPAGAPLEAPASFEYRAPPEHERVATVALTTRSRRGGASRDVVFETTRTCYRIEKGRIWWARASGTICDLDRPFDILIEESARFRGTATVTVTLEPGASHGRWTMFAELRKGIRVTYEGGGRARIDRDARGGPVLSFRPGRMVGQAHVDGAKPVVFQTDPVDIRLVPIDGSGPSP
jgi:hypothetical protein